MVVSTKKYQAFTLRALNQKSRKFIGNISVPNYINIESNVKVFFRSNLTCVLILLSRSDFRNKIEKLSFFPQPQLSDVLTTAICNV